MTRTYHMISGLPRSGSSLLSSILNQNPRFHADISGPLARFARAIISQSSAQAGYDIYCNEAKRIEIIRGIFDNYYSDQPESVEVAFNTNRGWTCLASLVQQLYPTAKMLLCVRDIHEVIESFERLHQSQPLKAHGVFDENQTDNVYTRAMGLTSDSGTIGFAFQCLTQILSNPQFKNMYKIIEYKDLTSNPEKVIKEVYDFIGEPYFEHDFNSVGYNNPTFDKLVGIDNLHLVRDTVKALEHPSILPADLRARFQGAESVWGGQQQKTFNPWLGVTK